MLEENELLRTLDAFFCFDNKPLILFFKDPQDRKALHQAIWNFNESPIAIILENNVVEIFNGFAIDENKQLLKRLGGNETLNDFTYFELVTGKTWEKYNDDIDHKNRVDYRLLENIEAVQKRLKEKGLTQTTANALLGKVIFFRYLIDRNVRLNYQEKELWNNEDLCNCLSNRNDFVAFIRHIENKDSGFNGDLFRISESEFSTIDQDALDILIRLLRSEEISTGQQSLFDMYDFSILPIEFISNMYEKFIGKENQEDGGAYYTPTFLVDYIVSETIGKKLTESDDYNCKVLDPACGSGIFLVESLRKIIEKYIEINEIKDTNTDDFRQALKSIAQENIFGIDKDPSAIQVAIFSVYLTFGLDSRRAVPGVFSGYSRKYPVLPQFPDAWSSGLCGTLLQRKGKRLQLPRICGRDRYHFKRADSVRYRAGNQHRRLQGRPWRAESDAGCYQKILGTGRRKDHLRCRCPQTGTYSVSFRGRGSHRAGSRIPVLRAV